MFFDATKRSVPCQQGSITGAEEPQATSLNCLRLDVIIPAQLLEDADTNNTGSRIGGQLRTLKTPKRATTPTLLYFTGSCFAEGEGAEGTQLTRNFATQTGSPEADSLIWVVMNTRAGALGFSGAAEMNGRRCCAGRKSSDNFSVEKCLNGDVRLYHLVVAGNRCFVPVSTASTM